MSPLGTFSRLPALASQLKMRTVLVNRREYKGSTPYTDVELDELNQGKKVFLERLAKELVHFLVTFGESNNIPKASADRKSGGIALTGWSMANHLTLSLLGHPDAVSSEMYSRLAPYLRHVIMYGTACDLCSYHVSVILTK